MFDSLAILQTEVHRALGHPDVKFLQPEDVTAAAIETLWCYGLEGQQSQYGRFSQHVTFFPSSRDASVNRADGMAVPNYVERRIGRAPNDAWVWVPAVHPSLLSENLERRVAWYSDSDGGLRLMLNYDPAGTEHRLWFYADPVVAQALNDPLGLPTRWGFLFLHGTILRVLPTMMNRAAQLPEAEQFSVAQLQAISAQISHSQSEVARLEQLRKAELDAERAPRGRNRKPVLGAFGLG